MNSENDKQYWRANLRWMGLLLAVWFAAAFIAGIVFVDELNQIRFFGFNLGFWLSQQGVIYLFVALIFIYCAVMVRLDRRYGVEEDE